MDHLVDRFETVRDADGVKEEHTGLHELEFIETRRYTVRDAVEFDLNGTVSMCNLVDGTAAMIVSPEGSFEPFEVHYAETFILPASLGRVRIETAGEEIKVLRAYVCG